MSNRPLLWRTWTLSKQYGKRPSELLGIDGVYRAWCLDEAVAHFGQTVESEVTEARDSTQGSAELKNGAADNKLRQMLGLSRKYRNPGAPPPSPSRPATPRPDDRE